MKATTKNPFCPLTASEKRSAEFLMEKMNVSKRELKEIASFYDVSLSQIIELMQLSKYEFVVKEELPGRCAPCKIGPRKMTLTKFW